MRRRSSVAGTPSAPAEETECTRVTRDSQSTHARGDRNKVAPVLSGKIASAMFSSPSFLSVRAYLPFRPRQFLIGDDANARTRKGNSFTLEFSIACRGRNVI
ncbi:hypothetical protein DBV15_02935 [Temnothorax longispinosus]|uniref:Uncharacterized protein n=1 Tax=Temnothorax longispinosus TaxID=300112 RepID=A0A4S2JPA3_9HYME|nr:hypothetical protein DBV15_02935 [Temnothorax longispinosus]